MRMPVVIPQVFYDVIARVLPGYVFLVMLRLVLHGTQLDLAWLDMQAPEDPMTLLAHGISSVPLCYFLGWFLRVTTIGNSEKQRAQQWEKRWKDKQRERQERNGKKANMELPAPLREMFQMIRLENENAGFRILKLRAEARMLETSRTAMLYSFLLSILLLCGELGGLRVFTHGFGWWLAKLGIPIVVGVTFLKHEQEAWAHYFGNILRVYQLLFPGSESGPQTLTPGAEESTEPADPATDSESAKHEGE